MTIMTEAITIMTVIITIMTVIIIASVGLGRHPGPTIMAVNLDSCAILITEALGFVKTVQMFPLVVLVVLIVILQDLLQTGEEMNALEYAPDLVSTKLRFSKCVDVLLPAPICSSMLQTTLKTNLSFS